MLGQIVAESNRNTFASLAINESEFHLLADTSIVSNGGSSDATEVDREALLMENLPSVRYIARKIHRKLPQHVDLDDLVSAGVVGLMDACNRFDRSRHVQFKSFAQFRIRGAILDSLRELDWSPRELRRKSRALDEANRVLAQRLGRTPSQQEIAEELKLTLQQLQQLLREIKGLEMGSLNEEHMDEPSSEELDYVAAGPGEDPLSLCLDGERRQTLIDAIELLPEKERLVLTLYYYEELTMSEIGLTLGVVESRVSQIRSSAVRRLRASFGLEPARPGKRGSRPARASKGMAGQLNPAA